MLYYCLKCKEMADSRKPEVWKIKNQELKYD